MFQAEVGARLDADTTFFVRETEIDVTQKLFSKNMRHGANPEDGLRLYPGNSTRCPQLSESAKNSFHKENLWFIRFITSSKFLVYSELLTILNSII